MSNPDFYDFGAGKGNSMARASQWWGGTGIGFDATPSRRAVAVSRGYDVRDGLLPDVMRELSADSARYSVINHVLEHMTDMATGREIIREAVRVSREFVYIAGPWFDSDRDLMLAGCKWFCNDWPKDHPTRVTMLDLHSSLAATGKIQGYAIWGRDRIDSTAHPNVYPMRSITEGIAAPYEYEYNRDGFKPSVGLVGCYSEICCIALTGKGDQNAVSEFEHHNPTAQRIILEVL